MEHTPEPWEVIGFQAARKPWCKVSIAKVVFDYVEECREYVADFQGVSTDKGKERAEANAARAVACVNALAGLNPEGVKDVVEALEMANLGMAASTLNAIAYEIEPSEYEKLTTTPEAKAAFFRGLAGHLREIEAALAKIKGK